MPMQPVERCRRRRRRLLPGLTATLLAVLLALSGAASVAAAPAPEPPGEDDRDVGPRTAPVHPGYATPEKARASVRARMRGGATHQHGQTTGTPGSQDPAIATGSAGTTATTATAADTTLDPAVHGSWQTTTYDLPLRAVHATALKNGKVLLIAGSGNSANDNVLKSFKAYLLDPVNGGLTSVPVPYDAFCAFHVVDDNGDVLVFGGTTAYKTSSSGWVGSDKVYKFVVDKGTWVALPPMRVGRWYPGAVLAADGKLYVYSGRDATGAVTTSQEMYDPATRAWTAIARRDLPMYPGLHLAADGQLFYSGAHYGGTHATVAPKRFHPVTGAKVSYGGSMLDLSHRNMAMSAVVGSADDQLVWVAGGGFPAVATTYLAEMDSATATAVTGPSLPAPKAYVSLSNLPDLTTVETGGGAGTASPVFETSILDPSTRTLRPMAPHTVPRTYHSSSLTLRDGRVVTFGGDPAGPADFVLKVEVFSPPYLFRGPRPILSETPPEVAYGGSYTLAATATGSTLSYATLLRPGSATHSTDSSQRSLRLATRVVEGGVQVTMPTDRDLLVPGWYYLTVVDTVGRPSVSRMVRLGGSATSPDTTPPTVSTRTPGPGATGVAVGSDVAVTFSEAVTGVSGATFTLSHGTTSVPATVTSSGGTAKLDPTADLAAGTTYTASLGSGIADAAGNALAPTSWTFTTAAPTTQPPPGEPTPTTRTIVVTAEADTMVKQANPTTAYGANQALLADGQELSTAGSAVHDYLRFNVTGIASGETVTGAELRLQALGSGGGTGNGPSVWRTEDTATTSAAESMTWNTGRPARQGSARVGDVGAVADLARAVTPLSGVTGNGLVSLELVPDSTDGLWYRSSEYATVGERPQIVLTVRSG